ncbi:MAG: XRE family transcriptional regulator [Marinilabiliales bacterium]|nr:XRE family transcriptional regulator [Marinilabiliales bacterium]
MTDQIQSIAQRIRELREISGISAESFARELGVEPGMLQQYESGTTDIPVGFLFKVANKFKMELSALLRGDQPRLHVYTVVRKGKGLSVERRKQYAYENLAWNFANKKAEPFLVTAAPLEGDKQPEFNSHPGQEFNYLLSGKLKVIVDGHEVILEEGDALYFDSGYRHAMMALDNQPARFLAVVF